MSKFSLLKQVQLRPQQIEALNIFDKTRSKYLVLEIPVGGGKSILGMSMAEKVLKKEEK